MKQILQKTSLFIILIVLFSCKKNVTPVIDAQADAKTVLLTKAPWKKTNEGTDNNKDGVVDVVSDRFLLPCNQDDIATFLTDGKLLWSEGPTKCDPAALDIATLKWSFTNDHTINMLDRDLTILKLTETEFVVYYEETDNGKAVWEMMQFKH